MVLIFMYGIILTLCYVNLHLIFRDKKRLDFDRTITALLIVIVLNVLLALYFRGNHAYGAYLYRASPFGFLYGPILYFIYKTSRDRKLGEQDFLHFLPFFISLLGYFALIFSDRFRDQFLLTYYQIHYISMCVSWLAYALWVLSSRIKKESKSTESLRIMISNALVSMLLCLSVFLMSIVYRYIYAEQFIKPDITACFIAVFMIISLILIFCYYTRFRIVVAPSVEVPAIRSLDTQQNPSYKSSFLSDQELSTYADKIIAYLQPEKFLNADLTQERLSKELKISKHDVSQVFNRSFNASFSKYINNMRIEYACTLLQSEDFNDNIDELIEQCGFNSKASFYRNFNSIKGCSPLEYRQKNIRL